MLKNMKVAYKIALGFSLVLILQTLVSYVGVGALKNAESSIGEYRSMARDSHLSADLQKNMLMVRMSVKNYLINHEAQALSDYEHYLEQMTTRLIDAKNSIEQSERARLVTQIELLMAEYQQGFSEVVSLSERKMETYDVIARQGGVMLDTIDEVFHDSEHNSENAITFHSALVLERLLDGRLSVMKYLQDNNYEQYQAAADKLNAPLIRELEQLKQIANAAQRQQLAVFEQAQRQYLVALKDIYTYNEAMKDKVTNTLDVIGVKVTDHSAALQVSVNDDQAILGTALSKNTHNSTRITLGLTAMALLIGVLAAFSITLGITRPLRRAVACAEQLAAGNLTVQVGPCSKDETGLLLQAIQHSTDKLREMMQTIIQSSNELAAASEELAVVTDQSTQSILQQETQTEMVATAINEMNSTVHAVAANAAKAAEATLQADGQTDKGAEVVEQAIHSIHALSKSVQNSSQSINQVQQDVANISTILDVIRGIADQTNLLALNAAIEAARAGEQGRGFAVVADEVRSLAARTQGSTAEIQDIIEKLQQGTHNTVVTMQEGSTLSSQCVDQASDVNHALGAINDAVGVINDMNIQIASAAEQQTTVTEQINQNVLVVKQIAEENAVAANQTRASSGDIAKLAEALNHMVLQFKLA